ncbi:SCL-interrupting locus protein isoform X1 [Alligator sinensis]|uniref:SCL-interrupting locus protein isoform X1 n=1 Tax=Alligator sinensis TaxID=38654 RepID=A0A1U8DG63_ALLSI|nr:SCL-interrupting locus protein isoform X1 [Alligator sinensis]XP_006015812.1 SCL-interrupting locus protein isoform X1 [Alligator sinensis]
MEAARAGPGNPVDPRIVSSRMVPLAFPPSKCALWDPTPIGDVIGSHLSFYRNPRLLMMEKTLRLAYRHAKQSEKKLFSCFLLGTLAVDEDGEGVSLTIDRFDPGREVTGGLEKVPTAPLPGDFLIPCTVNAWGYSSGDIIVHSSEDLSSAFKGLGQNLCSRDSLDLSKLLTVRTHIASVENMDNLHFDFHWAAISIANTLEYTPVKPVPIIPTALARNLSSHMNIAQVQGTYKCGYLTMDQTRKLLLVLESDPKAYSLPLVGVWLSGITHVYSPQVWAYCLRYLFSSSIQERVFSESGSFLITLYSLTHKEPEFYECLPYSGQTELGFQLLTSKETVHLFRNIEPSDKHPILFELNAEKQNAETEFFSKVSKTLSVRSPLQGSSPNKLSVSDHDSGVEDEDLSPRPIPSPHPVSQQVTSIRPSVPELSLVFGSFIESAPMSKPVENMNAKNLPPLVHPSVKKNCSAGPLSNQNHCSGNDKPNFSTPSGNPSLKLLPNQLNPKISTSKSCRGKQTSLQQLNCWKGGPQTRKKSGSSSSSSTPGSGPSPDTSVHQPRVPSERLASNLDGATQRKGEPSVRRPSTSNSKQPLAALQPFQYNFGFSPQNSRRPTDLQVPVPQVPSCYPANICSCCQLHGHIQYCPTKAWQGISKIGPSHALETQSDVPQETSTQAIFQQNFTCPNICCSPVCTINSPISLGYGKMGACSPHDNSLSPGVRLPSCSSPCSPQSCAAHSPCTHIPAPVVGSDHGMMGLSPDAYRILAEQDRQLKLLQAQIQRLLEAQTLQPCSAKTVTANNTLQSEKQVEFVTMETQSSPNLQMRKSVSIAVSTGASLFWNAPCERRDDSVSQVKKDATEISKEDMSISINTEQDTSNTSIASSLKAVDIPSFVESIHVVEGTNPAVLRNEPVSPASAPRSLLGESVSMCLQTGPTEGANNHVVVTNEQELPAVPSLPSHPSEDQKFYQDILGQVNRFLQSSSEESKHPSVKEEMVSSNSTISQNNNGSKKRNSEPDPGLADKDSVVSATLKQLRTLGVNIESPDKMKKRMHKVENASILACINPEAVIPGLNYMSFANVGMSGLTPNVVDLSMEANAIALKYLSENQLSQLSLNHSSQTSPVDSSLQNLLHTNMDKSMVGLSLISPNNMSFATKKYMKRYGLIQSNESSDDEEDLQVQNSRISVGKNENVSEPKAEPALEGFKGWKEHSERAGERSPANIKSYDSESASTPLTNLCSPVLRNITNEIFPPKVLHRSNEDSRPIHKDLEPKTKLLPGKIEFTQQPSRQNLGDVHISENLQTPTLETLNQRDNVNSVGTILDVKHLRQLPKLF